MSIGQSSMSGGTRGRSFTGLFAPPKCAASGRVIQAGCQLWIIKIIGSPTRPCSGWPLPFTAHSPRGSAWCSTSRKAAVGCKRAVRNQDFGFHFTFRPQVFFRPQILALSPLKESQQRRNQDHSKALALKIEIDMPYALVEPREAYPRGKSIFVHVSLTDSCTGFQLTCCALLGTVKC